MTAIKLGAIPKAEQFKRHTLPARHRDTGAVYNDEGHRHRVFRDGRAIGGRCRAGHRIRADSLGIGQLAPFNKRALARLFRGNTNFGFAPNTKISVAADSVVCTTSNVDITMRNCELTFASGKRSLTGPQANEIGATALAAGATSEGAAGSMIENLSKLVCTIDPNEIMKKAGGGAQCTFETGK